MGQKARGQASVARFETGKAAHVHESSGVRTPGVRENLVMPSPILTIGSLPTVTNGDFLDEYAN